MPIPGGFDVDIGGYQFVLDETITTIFRQPYRHMLVPVQASTGGQIAGMPSGESDARMTGSVDRLLWTMTDGIGGEGFRQWNPADPAVYDFGSQNARIRGQFTGRPLRTKVTISCDNRQHTPVLTIADGRLWIGGGQTLKSSEDWGDTFTDRTATLNLAANFKITAMVGYHDGVYVAAKNSTTGHHIIRRVVITGGATGTDVLADEVGKPHVGLQILSGELYAWTGRKMFQGDLNATLPLVLNKSWRAVGDTGSDIDYANYGGTSAGSWWGDLAVSENSVFAFVGLEGHTWVYEFTVTSASPLGSMTEIYQVPYGMTGKTFVNQNGVLYIAGHWSGESDATGGFGAEYALPLDSRVPGFVGFFRKSAGQNLQMQEACPSYGSQHMVAAAILGKIFIYDADYDAISLLDDLANVAGDKIGSMVTFGKRRFAVVYTPGSGGANNYQLFIWKSDEPGDRETVGTLSDDIEYGEYDFGFPEEVKTLQGFHVTFKPLVANQRIIVKYQFDQSGSYTATTTITSATAGNAQGRVFVPIANGVQGYRLKVKVTIDNNSTSGVAQPIWYSVTAEARCLNFTEVFELYLRMKDETQSKKGFGTTRKSMAEDIRLLLFTAARTKALLTFKDGTPYSGSRQPNHFDTYTVYIDQLEDNIQKGGGSDNSAEGFAFIRLIAVQS